MHIYIYIYMYTRIYIYIYIYICGWSAPRSPPRGASVSFASSGNITYVIVIW